MPLDVKNVHHDSTLSRVAIAYGNGTFIADEIAPVVPVQKESDYFYKFGKEIWDVPNAERAHKAAASEFNYAMSDDTYVCVEYALKSLVSDREIKNADTPLRPMTNATNMLTRLILLKIEDKVQTALRTAASLGGSVNLSTVGSNRQWDAASGTIVADITNGKESFRQLAGQYPNTIVIPGKIATTMTQDSEIQDLVKYTVNILAKDVDYPVLPPSLFGLKVLVPGGIKNTANPSQTRVISDLWGDDVLLAYVEPNPGIEVLSLAYQFRARELQVRRWRDEGRGGEMVEVSVIQCEKVVCSDAGYILKDALTT